MKNPGNKDKIRPLVTRHEVERRPGLFLFLQASFIHEGTIAWISCCLLAVEEIQDDEGNHAPSIPCLRPTQLLFLPLGRRVKE